MDERSLIWWIVQFTVTFIDIANAYMLTHAMLKRRIILNAKHVAMILLLTVGIAPIFNFNTYIFRMVIIVAILLMVKYISKRGLGDVAIIYGLTLVLIAIFQSPLIIG